MSFSEALIMAAANAAPRGVEGLIRGIVASDTLLNWTGALTKRTIRRVKRADRIAVVSDTNIGDAIVLQSACSTFKQWLPDCQVDYFYQRKAHPLLMANPWIDGRYPVFTDADFTSAVNRSAVQSAVRGRKYDLILNLYPFLMNSELAAAGCPVLAPHGLIANIIRAERNPTAKAHVTFQLRGYVENLTRSLPGRRESRISDDHDGLNVICLAEDVPDRAGETLKAAGIGDNDRLAFLNPDSSSRFSCIPLQMQADLLRGLLEMDDFERVLVGPAYSFVGLPDELCSTVAGHPKVAKLARLAQDIPIDVYAGIIDRADLFITADTAQMHIAAARRVTPGSRSGFRNRTTLVSIFGATHSRVYGYDSFSPGYMDSSQDAPAKVFDGTPHCRNLTCIHKTRKTCPTVECFTGLEAATVMNWIRSSPIIVVSGLPRSGTSLMMQMLEAGGIPIATDGVRTADADNPRGYYELEDVKRLSRDASWLSGCRGKAVKIISMLLPELPSQHEYRIIFMERALPEVLASQKKMLQRRGMPDDEERDGELAAGYERHLASVKQSLARLPNAETLYVSYGKLVESPHQGAAEIRRFLRKELRLEAMAAAVDSQLHRHKVPSGNGNGD